AFKVNTFKKRVVNNPVFRNSKAKNTSCNFSAMPSPVWTYFKKMGNPLCISCGKLVTSTNTTNMWFHLEKQHHKIYIDLKK
ncbi:hypothetical protein Bhyg_17680, partial [Pseudolycoriella hygida]